jgi:hypothetical protein
MAEDAGPRIYVPSTQQMRCRAAKPPSGSPPGAVWSTHDRPRRYFTGISGELDDCYLWRITSSMI